jgi:menaquinone-specific isochorismate synthase
MTPSHKDIGHISDMSMPAYQATIDQQLAEAVAQLDQLSGSFEPIPVSFTARCDKIDILTWLKRVDTTPRVYWRDRDNKYEVAGVGSAITVARTRPEDFADGFGHISSILKLRHNSPFLRFFGGTRFDPESQADDHWRHFPAMWFVLPRLIVTRSGHDFYLTFTTLWDGKAGIEYLRTRLMEAFELFLHVVAENDGPMPSIVSRTDKPDRSEWSTGVQRILDSITSGTVSKTVLARRTDLRLSHPLDPCDYLRALLAKSKHCFGFIVQTTRSAAFVGLTPERLFLVDDHHLSTEALAGTILVGKNAEETAARARQLRDDPKNRQEQRFVVDDLNTKLAALCSKFDSAKDPEVVQLAHVQHLISRFTGTLNPSVTPSDILAAIHPTAAVCGLPKEPALSLLRDIEHFDRGWFSSAVGTISHHSTDMAVAIRSGLICGNTISLFAGAGIVAGSDPDLEWQELENKIAAAIKPLSGTHE